MTEAPKPSQVGPTKGPWRVNANVSALVEQDDTMGLFVADCRMLDEGAANARLIAEAGTVYSETGLSPRALLEQRDNAVRAVAALMRNKTCNPLAMTPDERRALWRSHELARAVLSRGQDWRPLPPPPAAARGE